MSANPPPPTPMNIPELSPSLKHIRKFLIQAKQLERVDVVMAYLCRMHAVTEGLKIKDRTKSDTAYLVALLDWIENNQIAVAGMSTEERATRAENFALSVFEAGDNVDRAGQADESTAKCFLSAHVLFEVCTMFGPLKPELKEKSKYAAWKAVEIRKALKEGRRPLPGDALDVAAIETLEKNDGNFGMSMDNENTSAADMNSSLNTGKNLLSSIPTNQLSRMDQTMNQDTQSMKSHNGYAAANRETTPTMRQTPEAFSNQSDIRYSPREKDTPYNQNDNTSKNSVKSPMNIDSKVGGAPYRSPPSSSSVQQQPNQRYREADEKGDRVHNVVPSKSKSKAIAEADKLTRHATSALQFEDIPTAILKLQQAIEFLRPYEHARSSIYDDPDHDD